MKDAATPHVVLAVAIAVAVTLSDGGNHLQESSGPTLRATGADSPLKR